MQPRLLRHRLRDACVLLRVVRERNLVLVAVLRCPAPILGLCSLAELDGDLPLEVCVALPRPVEAEPRADKRAIGEAVDAEGTLERVHERPVGGPVDVAVGGAVTLRAEDPALPALDAPEAKEGGEQDEPAYVFMSMCASLCQRNNVPMVMSKKDIHSAAVSPRKNELVPSAFVGSVVVVGTVPFKCL